MGPGVLEPAEIARIERLALTPDRKVPASSTGPHRSVIHGRSLDVVEWREYQPGDDPRTIDVQAWARLDQVLVRLYEGDVDLRVQLVVDTSASMATGDKLRHAKRVAAAIGAAALLRNESVSVGSLQDRVPRRYRSRTSLAPFLAHIDSWQAGGDTPLLARSRELNASTRRPGLVVVVSDFLTPDALDAIDQLAARRSQLLAVLVASEFDENPDLLGEVQLVDVESGERVDVDLSPELITQFRARRAASRRALEQRLARHGSRLVVSWATEDLLGEVVPKLSTAGLLR